MQGFGTVHKCRICGKKFYVPIAGEWAYVLNKRLVCSWGCLRKGEKTEGHTYKAWMPKDVKDVPEHWYRIRAMRDEGVPHREIAKKFGLRETSIGSIISKLNKIEMERSK